MITVVGVVAMVSVVSSRNWDETIISWSELDNIAHDSFTNDNMQEFFLHADNRFLGTWMTTRTPHRGTAQFHLNNRQLKEVAAMKNSNYDRMVLWNYYFFLEIV